MFIYLFSPGVEKSSGILEDRVENLGTRKNSAVWLKHKNNKTLYKVGKNKIHMCTL